MRYSTPNLLLVMAGTPRRRFLFRVLSGTGAAMSLREPLLRARNVAAEAHADLAATLVADWDVPEGRFYTQTAPQGAPADSGYVVGDTEGVPFWREYRALGGPAQLGYPISSRYAEDRHRYQVLQAGVLRWNADAGHADIHTVFTALSEQGLDGWLAGQGIPTPAPALVDDPQLPPDTRLGWLTNPLLRAAYQMSDEATSHRRFGLPMSDPQRFGPYLAQRFEKAVLQLWLDAAPGQPSPGTVSLVQVGDLLQSAGLVPPAALEPQPAPAPRPVVEAPRPTAAAAEVIAPGAATSQGKYVAVSVGRQWWYAYEDGRLLFNGPVTTGRPELFTPIGRYTVLSRHSPYTFAGPFHQTEGGVQWRSSADGARS